MTARTHIVLVPGFVGFDALGQLEYYAGVTDAFMHWQSVREDRAPIATLHYFDNFPTASVGLRATRLREYLMKRIARGEFAEGDRVTLVAHSTGGLDVRQMLWDLHTNPGQRCKVDARTEVTPPQLLARLRHVVFLSVPHYGTNLGDFGWSVRETLQALVRGVGLAMQLNREPITKLRGWIERYLSAGQSDLLRAINDALNESDENRGANEEQRAKEREARAQLALWLEHMGKDFDVIADLRSAAGVKPGESSSPAHFDEPTRERELAFWRAHDIRTSSYVTRAPRNPLAASESGQQLVRALKVVGGPTNLVSKLLNGLTERWLLQPLAAAAVVTRAVPLLGTPVAYSLLKFRPALVFEIFYALCADQSGAFQRTGTNLDPLLHSLDGTITQPTSGLEVSDSDGVVNSLSMCWPFEPRDPTRHPHYVVEADHGDIIGHYELKPKEGLPHDAEQTSDRRYTSYDIFPSGSKFDDKSFEQVWNHVFDACLRGPAA
jgi:triacylglycerol lipase